MKTFLAFACSAAFVLGAFASPSIAAEALKVGDDAPNFELQASDGCHFEQGPVRFSELIELALE